MASHRNRTSAEGRRRRTGPRWLLPAVALAVIAVTAVILLRPGASTEPVAWTRFDTQDVHSLAFVGDDAQRVLFGHHGGLYESTDAGRTWSSMPLRDDAMSMAPAGDGSIVIAGHEVFTASADGGATWTPVVTDLPSLDIHGFTRDPADPAHMWAYLATGGLWESGDFGAHFTRVREDNVLFPTAIRQGESTRLLGVDTNGFVGSDDGGRTWTSLSLPDFGPLTSLVATPDGRVVFAGSPTGVFRSGDGARTWTATAYQGSAFAIATTADGRTVGVVSRETDFFRSSDGGATWPGPD